MNEGITPIRAARQRRAQGTVIDFDGRRLALARRLSRMTRAALARAVGVTPAAITQYEQALSRPTTPVLAQMALTLGMPAEFFRYGQPLPAIPATTAHFRSLRATPASRRDQALAFAELSLVVTQAVEQQVDLPAVSLPFLELPEELTATEVAHAARATRGAMGVTAGPIGHMVRLLEVHGILVLRLPPTVDPAVDAFSTQSANRPVVALSPLKNDKARSRFDAAHELGHLVMHHDAEPGNKVVENQAHSFAAEFLMPADEVVDDLPRRLDWGQLHVAKRRWGTSLKALVYRSFKLGVITESTYQRANRTLAMAGNPEAGPLGPPESPTMLGAAVSLLTDNGVTVDDLAMATTLPLSQVELVVRAGSDIRPTLSLTID